MTKIFISYSHRDIDIVSELREELASSHDAWTDISIKPGAKWSKEIEVAIPACDIFLIVVPSSTIISNAIMRECNLAKKLRKCIIPICINSVNHYFLKNYHLSHLQAMRLRVRRPSMFKSKPRNCVMVDVKAIMKEMRSADT
jgi:hypothetical protein